MSLQNKTDDIIKMNLNIYTNKELWQMLEEIDEMIGNHPYLKADKYEIHQEIIIREKRRVV